MQALDYVMNLYRDDLAEARFKLSQDKDNDHLKWAVLKLETSLAKFEAEKERLT